VALPDVGQVRAAYSVPLQLQDDILHYVLNTNTSNPTTLPVHVSYRPLWPLSSSAGNDAIAAGLPLVSVEMDSISNQVYRDSNYSGPAGGPSQMFATYLQPGFYLRTIAPQAPFDATFPPDVGVVGVIESSSFEDDSMTLDATSAEGTDHPIIPTFSLTFIGGSGTFDGWSALLRDQATKQTLSSVVSLSGAMVNNLSLPTNHHPPDGDALTGAELFLAPPVGEPVPARVFAPQGGTLTSNVRLPALPPPTVVTGTVSATSGRPVEADIVFEATGIAESHGQLPQGMPCALNIANYEYATQASARIGATGSSTWVAVLPVGQYRVSIRPLDPIASPPAAPLPVAAFGVTMVSPFSVGPAAEACTPPSDTALGVSTTQLIEGVAVVADGRPVSGAEVDAIPVRCVDGSAAAACLPKPRQMGTADDGSFGLLLDPGGSYVLRARPADGTRLPWTFLPKPLVVAPGSTMTPRIVVPAPISAGLTLLDPNTNAIPNAVVRMFGLDPAGRWIDVGHAVTDSSGHYDMYLAPPAQ
jgi:hypothetical protein